MDLFELFGESEQSCLTIKLQYLPGQWSFDTTMPQQKCSLHIVQINKNEQMNIVGSFVEISNFVFACTIFIA
jgi:hypothetical protein